MGQIIPLIQRDLIFEMTGLSRQDLETLLSSFQFRNCAQRSELINILAEQATHPA